MFATVVNCMDGRTQLPVNRFAQERFGVPYVDTITEAGPIRALTDGDRALAESIYSRVCISVEKHKSHGIILVAHHDCAGNGASKEAQLRQLDTAATQTAERFAGVEVVGVWVDEQWQVHPVLTRRWLPGGQEK